jgi:hypothetical protein
VNSRIAFIAPEFAQLFITPRVFWAIIEQALLRGDTKNIPARTNTGTAIKRPITGKTVTPVPAKNKPTTMRIKPMVTLDTRSNRHSFLFILSPLF